MNRLSSFSIGLVIGIASLAHAFWIDHGKPARDGQFPAVVKIGAFTEFLGLEIDRGGACTGTLIAPHIVLTAAHCVQTSGRMRVSSAGQAEGLTAGAWWGLAEGGGYLVKESYRSSEWVKRNEKVEEQRAFIEKQAELMQADPGYAEVLQETYRQRLIDAARYDRAFLVLEKAQEVAAENLPKIACDRLPMETQVQYAGFGVDYGSGSSRNANPDLVLHYGENQLDEDAEETGLYSARSGEGTQLINSGDSGGPLFVAGRQDRIYGTAAAVDFHRNGAAKRSYHTPSGSPLAFDFYRELSTNPTVPSALKKTIQHCL